MIQAHFRQGDKGGGSATTKDISHFFKDTYLLLQALLLFFKVILIKIAALWKPITNYF
jgi:hypothetical protein